MFVNTQYVFPENIITPRDYENVVTPRIAFVIDENDPQYGVGGINELTPQGHGGLMN